MTQFEIKEKLISKINQLDDDFVLSEIYNILENDSKGIYILSENQIEEINYAIKQIDEGIYISNEVATSEIEQWLQK